MKKCPFCGTENPATTLFCEWCGKRVTAEAKEGIAKLSVSNDERATENNLKALRIDHREDSNKQTKLDEFVPQVSGLYDGKVTRIFTFGAFVELAPGTEGMVHISQLAEHRIEKVEDVVGLGDMIWVKITEIDGKGRIALSHKDALREIEIRRQKGELIM